MYVYSDSMRQSYFQRSQIVGARLPGTSVTKTSHLLGISRGTASKVMATYTHLGRIRVEKQNSRRKDKRTTAAQVTIKFNQYLDHPVFLIIVSRHLQLCHSSNSQASFHRC
ncbi:hypothetical protein TNCV_2460121 [Trichonephila clavipes]|nr:hypothetical protein TNCV_2460121 [Trichonephila clavipes]